MSFYQYFDGLCPECLSKDMNKELWLNRGDLFECPQCHLQISLASGLRATICRRRGHGKFKSLEDRYYAATNHARGLLLVRESLTRPYEADGLDTFESAGELINYLSEIKEAE
ncbi:MAG: hypothetical protein AB1724_10910 [Thermodesulfobacteriota bacterium]